MTEAVNVSEQNAVDMSIAPSVMPTLADFVDLDTYPIDDPDSPKRKALVEQCRKELDAVGCCRIPNIIRPESMNGCVRKWSASGKISTGQKTVITLI